MPMATGRKPHTLKLGLKKVLNANPRGRLM